MQVVGGTRLRKIIAFLAVGAALVLLFGVMAWASPEHTYGDALGEMAMMGVAGMVIAGVLVMLVHQISRRVGR